MRDWPQRLQNRDASALLAIYDRWSRPLFALIQRITQRPDEAEGLLAEVFEAFWEKSQNPGFIQGSIFGMLVDMARFRALDAVEARDFKNRTQAWAAFEPTDRFSDPAELRMWEKLPFAERQRRAKAALEGLAPQERLMVEQALFEGLTCTRLAIRHNSSIADMRGKITLAVQKLESALEGTLS